MSSGREEGPVYYREIQKNAYLKRIPNEVTGSKLRPLGSKKVPLKAMWTQFCVHNGRTPYLEQYPEAESPATLAHKPVWRACLLTARHVTASVTPHTGHQYDFLIDTELGAVRMLAPDWESMQDWVTTLRNTLHELKILSKGENVYCGGPAPSVARAAARDPTSPLPPTPRHPPDRVPGIELIPPRTIEPIRQPEPTPAPPPPTDSIQPTPAPPTTETIPENVDISNWDTTSNHGLSLPNNHGFSSLPSTSRLETSSEARKIEAKPEARRGLTKICGQNICLDDSLFKRSNNTDSDEEFFAEIDRMSDGDEEYKQRVVVTNGEKENVGEGSNSTTNVTVIQVSNRDPPHTAIPVLGPETDVFDFEFKQKLTITEQNPNFINIVNTEGHDYGTTFSNSTTYTNTKTESDYGHISLTTTVSLPGTNDTEFVPESTPKNEDVYERLCLASTSNSKASPLPVKKLKSLDKSRKSSLPNLEVGESTYEYLFLSNNNASTVNVTTEVNCNGESRVQVNSGSNDPPVTSVRSVERSRSQNAYDAPVRTRENVTRRMQNNSPKREIKNETTESTQNHKPIWKRGLTELSLLTRLKSIGLTKKQESPTRNDNSHDRSPAVTSPVKVVHRSRPEGRIDSSRRRSSSLSNGQVQAPIIPMGLTPLRARQAATLRAEQRRGAALVASVSVRDGLVFADYDDHVWVAWWGNSAPRSCGKAGDRVAALGGAPVPNASRAAALMHAHSRPLDILFHRVPLGKIFVINKRDQELIGLRIDAECNIVKVEANSPAARAGVPPAGHWALTEINNRPINLLKGGEAEMNRLSRHGTEVSILIQPSTLVKRLRAALKSHKTMYTSSVR